jgi:hypothetical protein
VTVQVEPPGALIDGRLLTIAQMEDLATAITQLATLHRRTPGIPSS